MTTAFDDSATVAAARRDAAGVLPARTPWQLFSRRLRDDKVALAAGAFIVFLVLVALFAPLIVRAVAHPPNAQYPEALDPQFGTPTRSEEHTSELQSRQYLVCRLLLE